MSSVPSVLIQMRASWLFCVSFASLPCCIIVNATDSWHLSPTSERVSPSLTVQFCGHEFVEFVLTALGRFEALQVSTLIPVDYGYKYFSNAHPDLDQRVFAYQVPLRTLTVVFQLVISCIACCGLR